MKHYPKLLSIKLSQKKGKERVSVEEGQLKSGHGLIGDSYAKPGDREVCLMSIETRNKLINYQDGLCIQRFVETLLIDLSPDVMAVGDQLIICDVIIEVTRKGKRCFPECQLIKNGQTCPLVHEPLFGKVIKGGTIRVSES